MLLKFGKRTIFVFPASAVVNVTVNVSQTFTLVFCMETSSFAPVPPSSFTKSGASTSDFMRTYSVVPPLAIGIDLSIVVNVPPEAVPTALFPNVVM